MRHETVRGQVKSKAADVLDRAQRDDVDRDGEKVQGGKGDKQGL